MADIISGVSQQEIIYPDNQDEILTCPNRDRGCRWKGWCVNYKDHKQRCNLQHVICYCRDVVFKGDLANHLVNKCRHRKVDYHTGGEFVYCPPYLHFVPIYVKCPMSGIYGCEWIGTKSRYEEVHVYQCYFQNVTCICGDLVKKFFLAEHLAHFCKRKLNSPPGVSYAATTNTIHETTNVLGPDTVVKKSQDKGIQCDLQLLNRDRNLLDPSNYYNKRTNT